MIKLADDLQIEVSRAVGQRFAAIGKSGSGKTNTLGTFALEWDAADLPVTMLDPMGQFVKLPIRAIIAGRGETAHIEINEANAEALAKLSVLERISVILDMSLYKDDESLSILQIYLETLWSVQFTATPPQPYALVIDEAQLYAPQSGVTVLSKIIIDMAKRGRHKKLTTVVATQRAASLVKDFLTQATLLIAHRLSFGVDTKILQEQLPLPTRDLNAMMRKLATGEALVIGDAALVGDVDYLRVQIRETLTNSEETDNAAPAPGRDLGEIMQMLEALKAAPAEADGEPAAPDDATRQKLTEANLQIDLQNRQIAKLELELGDKELLISQLRDTIKRAQRTPALPGMQPATVLVTGNGFQDAATGASINGAAGTVLASDAVQRSANRQARRIKRQQQEFNTLLANFKQLPLLHRSVAVLLLDNAGQWMDAERIAARLGYSAEAISKNPPKELIRLGIIYRDRVDGCLQYTEDIDALEERFPDLDVDELVEQLIEAGVK